VDAFLTEMMCKVQRTAKGEGIGLHFLLQANWAMRRGSFYPVLMQGGGKSVLDREKEKSFKGKGGSKAPASRIWKSGKKLEQP